MKRRETKWRKAAGVLALAAALACTAPGAAYGTPEGEAAAETAETSERTVPYTLEQVRQMQEEILAWKQAADGGELFLTGSILEGAGDAGSDWFAFDISRIGWEDNQAAYLSRMKGVVEGIYQDMETSQKRYRVSDIHRLVLTIEACGGNPESFGTDPDGNSINLIQDSIWNSLWGDPGRQGINGYVWALLAADSRNWEEPADAQWTREGMVTAILARQLEDGGFGLILTDSADVDLTSMALTALAPYGNSDQAYTFVSEVTGEEVTETVDQAAERAFACLAGFQQEDGTMLTYSERTSESTAWALMALASWGRDPNEDLQFIQNGQTLLDGMAAFQLEDGGSIHSLDGDQAETAGNNMAGYQTVYGLEAVCRLWEGRGRVFDLSDAPIVTEEEIEAAGASLTEQAEEMESAAPEAAEEAPDTEEGRMIWMAAAIAAVVVAAAIAFTALILRDRKKQAGQEKNAGEALEQEDDEDEEDW